MIFTETEYVRINRDAPLMGFRYMIVWLWKDAPEWAQAKSAHGGDEECAVWVPRDLQQGDGSYPSQIEALWRGYQGEDYFQYNNGLLIIWSH